MNCPHCGLAIPTKPKGARVRGEVMYRQDVEKAEAAIAVLPRAMVNPFADLPAYLARPAGPYVNDSFADAVQSEIARLREAIADPAKLYAIYRRGDKKTPIAYGMVAA